MRHIRATVGAVITLLILLSAGVCPAQEPQVVATVNGQPIMSTGLDAELYRRWGDMTLGAMIQELAVEQAAAEAGVSVTDEEVEERKDNFQQNIDMQGMQTGTNFSMWLAKQKMSPYAFRKWIRSELLLERIVADDAAVTDEEITQYWQQNQGRFRQPERMRVSHICVKDRATADQVRQEILDGKPFEQAAKEYSIDPYTQDEGGAFGVITRGESSFQRAAFMLDADNQMTDPIQTEKGWHIIRRDEYMAACTPGFDEVKNQIRSRLESQKLMMLISQKRSEVMQNARVEHEIDPDDLATN